jgi:flagellar biosynthesis protein FlhF
MIIKKFTGKTEEEAIGAAKAELGENVVIMSTRNAKKKGFFSFLHAPMIEVTVAKEENENYGAKHNLPEKDIKETFEQVAKVAKIAEDKEKLEAKKTEELEKVKEEEESLSHKLDNLQSMLSQKLEVRVEEVNSDEAIKETEKKQEKKEQEMEQFIKLLRQTMTDSEMDSKYIDQIIEEMSESSKPGVPFDTALADVYQRMILKFGKAEPIKPATKNPKVVFFIGPTGVGKTTTIAKLASRFSLNDEKKVALLTTDTYRIAAAEQLRTYANILSVPFRIIYSEEEMGKALEDFHSFDYILVDTAGHSQKNAEQKELTEGFLSSVGEEYEKEVFLVLSANTKYRDLLEIADTYKKMTQFKLIFTKLDETSALGCLLNLKLYTGASLCYITNGQNVPGDLEEFNPQKVVKLLLGGKN